MLVLVCQGLIPAPEFPNCGALGKLCNLSGLFSAICKMGIMTVTLLQGYQKGSVSFVCKALHRVSCSYSYLQSGNSPQILEDCEKG